MKTIVDLVVERTGISEEQARGAVDTVVGYLKQQLPAPIAGQLDNALTADVSGVSAQAEQLIRGSLGGLFGNKE